MPTDPLGFSHPLFAPRKRKTTNPFIQSLAAGCICALALPPFGLFPVWIYSFPALLSVIGHRVSSFKGAIFAGWCFGSGYFVIAQYWTTPAFIELYREHAWLFPVSLLIIPMVLGLLWGCAAGIAFFFRSNAIALTLALSSLFTAAEYLRSSDYLFNFPWNLIGYGLYRIDGLLQFASVSGIFGLTFLTLIVSSLPYLWSRRGDHQQINYAVYTILVCASLLCIWGYLRPPVETALSSEMNVVVVQPNIPQFKKEEKAYRDENLGVLLDLMGRISPAPDKKTLVVFPETLFTMHRDEEPIVYETIGKALPENGIAAVGIRRFTPYPNGMDVRNSLVFINRSGELLATYDKHILSPWGEFVPYRSLWEHTFLRSILDDTTSLDRGTGPVTLRIGGFPSLHPMICYESAFPRYSLTGSDRPQLQVLPSNDGLSDDTTEPFQSFLNVRVRAIETGVPVARSANSGISAIIDPYGRILASIPINSAGVIHGDLPLSASPTFYSRYGDTPLLGVLVILMGLAVVLVISGEKRCRT